MLCDCDTDSVCCNGMMVAGKKGQGKLIYGCEIDSQLQEMYMFTRTVSLSSIMAKGSKYFQNDNDLCNLCGKTVRLSE